MNEHGTAEAALAALPAVAAEAGLSGYRTCTRETAQAEWTRARHCGAAPVAFGSPDYPEALAQIPDPPPLLWCMGDTSILKRPMLALVGARNASSLGTRMARKLAADLGEAGYVIVSGLARGIDASAHTAALGTGTVAVMAGGVDVIYPTENAVLGQDIADSGIRISEIEMSAQPTARHFPRRNRIVSGLAQAVIVVEAAGKSGSLITARTALDQGREVLAVPGHPFDPRASGCNILIRDGATLVRGARDVIAALSQPEGGTADKGRPEPDSRPVFSERTADMHRQILERLGPNPVPEDQLIRDLDGVAAQISPEISTLELEGRIRRDPGGLLSRVD
ncbi:MAG: DNA-processing protein DprA [Silicimonas sp.]|jgi:DNA processing protein|nr:DNA-processing protein DprA [Silicimonas sp.]